MCIAQVLQYNQEHTRIGGRETRQSRRTMCSWLASGLLAALALLLSITTITPTASTYREAHGTGGV